MDLRAIRPYLAIYNPERSWFPGVIQAAIANAGFNSACFSTLGPARRIDHDNDRRASNFTYLGGVCEQIANRAEFMGNPFWGRGIWMYQDERTYWDYRTFDGLGSNQASKAPHRVQGRLRLRRGPRKLQAVENSVSAAMMPGWLSQGDVLEPSHRHLAPFGLFVIRATGEADARTASNVLPRGRGPANSSIVVNEKEVSFDYNQGREVPETPPATDLANPSTTGTATANGTREPWLDLNRNALTPPASAPPKATRWSNRPPGARRRGLFRRTPPTNPYRTAQREVRPTVPHRQV